MNDNIHISTAHAEPGHLSWLRVRASGDVEALLPTLKEVLTEDCAEILREVFFLLLQKVCKPALDVLYYNGDIGNDEEILSRGEELTEKACPRLMELLCLTERQFSNALREAFTRVEEYREQIAAILLNGKAFRKITGIRLHGGDVHDHGRQVIIFDTDAGEFVYKPHSLVTDRVVRALSETFFPEFFYVPRAVCGDGFGFEEYVENRPAGTEQEAKLYYYRLGGLCAVSRMLGSTDLHIENILCRNAFPVPVDLETAFSASLLGYGPDDSPEDTRLDHCLLPASKADYFFSPLFNTSERNAAAPFLGGERKTVEYSFETFLEGFRTAYLRGMEKRDELLRYANEITDLPVRVILRDTRGYMKLINAARRWKWLCSPETETEVRRVLSEASVGGCPPGKHQVESEAAAVLRGDVPYFTVRMDGHDIHDPDGITEKGRVAKSPREHLLQCIRHLSEQDLELHCRLFEQARVTRYD